MVKALNDDLPFDQFTIWQVAGDLLPQATIDQKIASGFNRNHLLNGEGGAIAEEQRFVNLFDRVDTTATTWLGLTMACAQCHDHKFDPITQRDYYGLLDAFNRVPESGTPQYFSSRIRIAAPFIELPTEENKARIAEFQSQISAAERDTRLSADSAFEGWRAGILAGARPAEGKGLPDGLVTILHKPEADRTDSERKSLDADLRKYFDDKVRPSIAGRLPVIAKPDGLRKQLANYQGDKVPRVMVMSDAKPRQTAILTRGEYLKPTEKVSFSTPSFLPPLPRGSPTNRLGFARWLFAPEHPLTARVQVNRMWQHFFGTGIVKTPEDFGVQSEYPSHGALLDWLAVEFRTRGWSTKAMHKLIVTSATYRQSSRVTAEHRARDSTTACSRARAGFGCRRSFFATGRSHPPDCSIGESAARRSILISPTRSGRPSPSRTSATLPIRLPSGNDLYRRSLYTFWRRTVGPANMFDASNRQTCRVRSTTTSTPLHALTTLNDPTWVEAARLLARHSMKASHDLDGRLTYAFRRVICRKPTDH